MACADGLPAGTADAAIDIGIPLPIFIIIRIWSIIGMPPMGSDGAAAWGAVPGPGMAGMAGLAAGGVAG